MKAKSTPARRREPAAGDVVVTKVANHYNVGRAQADGTPLAAIETIDRLADALTLACRLIAGSQRVFLYDRGGLLHRVEVDCAKPH